MGFAPTRGFRTYSGAWDWINELGSWCPPRPVRNHRAARRGRHGRRVEGARHPDQLLGRVDALGNWDGATHKGSIREAIASLEKTLAVGIPRRLVYLAAAYR